MKKFNIIKVFVLSIVLGACSSSSDPVVVNEEELITTLRVTLTPQGGGSAITLEMADLDGDGPTAPTVTVSGPLQNSTTYNGTVVVLNETENPAENITTEVLEEALEHQFFYTITNGIATVAYTDADSNNNPIGVTFTLTTGAAGTGSLTVTLRHEPNKSAMGVSAGDITNAGGETDVTATFPLTVN